MHELSIRSPLSNAPVYHVAETSSTMDDARRLVEHGAVSGTVVVTDHQLAGRGRRAGRVWHSPPREGLMFTLALERPREPVTRSLAMAAAIAQVIETDYDLAVQVKWPNDVLVNGRKICGILADHDGRWLYLGVGLNVMQERFPEEIVPVATSIARETGSLPGAWENARDTLLVHVLTRFVDTGTSWLGVLRERLWMKDRDVEVALPAGERRRVTIRGIEPDGRLIVEAGGLHRLSAGEVSLYANGRTT